MTFWSYGRKEHAHQSETMNFTLRSKSKVHVYASVLGLYLLSSFPPPNTFGSGRKDNVSSVKGSSGSSVVLRMCTSCYSALIVWRSPAKREPDLLPLFLQITTLINNIHNLSYYNYLLVLDCGYARTKNFWNSHRMHISIWTFQSMSCTLQLSQVSSP